MPRRFVLRELNPMRRERKQTITDAFLGNIGVPGLGGLLFGAISAILILASNKVDLLAASNTFFWAVVVLFAILFFVRLFKERGLDQLAHWGVISLSLLGFGLGTLIYLLRDWGTWVWMEFREGAWWCWREFRLIDQPHEWLLTSLCLTGVILGFFVVRNWSKDQGDFVKSLTAVFGGAFVTTLLGDATEVGKETAFAYYAIGFTVSGVLNLVASSCLIASYSANRSPSSRSVLSFLYGSDKAEAVDKQFLKNFEEDPNYARRLLINTVLEYEKKVRLEFANKREQQRKQRREDLASPLCYYELLAIECPAPASAAVEVQSPPDTEIQSPPETEAQPRAAAAALPEAQINATTPMKVVFRSIDEEPISEKMFRSAVSLKWKDNLEFIDAAAAYTKSFPYFGSVAGVALEVLQTVVMDRDKNKRFRTTAHPQGLCPVNIEQARGLDEIDYLSYIAVPVASYLGQPEQTRLGVLHVDTRLFAAPRDFKPTPVAGQKGIFSATLRPADLTEYANNLYDRDDDSGVKYLEEMRAVLVPVLQLYLTCRQGSV
jgi:hypothetical protein